MNPIAKTEHRDYESAIEEFNHWGRTLSRMRYDPQFNDVVPYNRRDVIERRKELLKQAAILKIRGWGVEVEEKGLHHIIELSEFSQEEVFVSKSVRRWVYHD